MSTKAGTKMTWLDVAASVDDGGRTLMIAEMMNQVNELGGLVMQDANSGQSHKGAIRTGIPAPTRRRLNKGVANSKATQRAVTFESAAYEGRGEIDEELIAIAPNKEDFRLRQNRAHIEGMSQQFATDVFYCDVESTPDGLTGFSAYYNDLSADSGANIVSAGGSTNGQQTSLWLIVSSEDAISLFTPDGATAGIQAIDKDREKVFDSDSNPYYAFVDQYKLKAGLAVQDWRQGGRIANIDVTALASVGKETDSSYPLFMAAIELKRKVWNINGGNAGWYGNRTVLAALEKQALNKANGMVTMEHLQNGVTMTRLMGLPFNRVDAIVDTEDVVA